MAATNRHGAGKLTTYLDDRASFFFVDSLHFRLNIPVALAALH